jgi:Fe-S-cluster-containing dehydrogenase component
MTRKTTIPIRPLTNAAEKSQPLHDGHSSDDVPHGIDRRSFLKLMAASAALAGAGCSGPPTESIVPYVSMPELVVPGHPLYYATVFSHRGYAQGVLVASNMGRPTKVEGNPYHPASLGATDVFAQASILQMWDPDRSQTVYQGPALSTWEAFDDALQAQRASWEKDGGAGLRILTGSVTSPTLTGQLQALLQRYPHARWHNWDPLYDDGAAVAAQLAFGQPADALFRFDRATLVLTLDADVFGDWPGSIRYARDFVARRRSAAAQFNSRLYAVESTPGLTGVMADNQLALSPPQMEQLIWRVAARLGMPGMPTDIPTASSDQAAQWETILAKNLAAHKGSSLIVGGDTLSAHTLALVHAMNAYLGNDGSTVQYIAPVQTGAVSHAESITQLCIDMQDAAVKSLFILGANPVYTAPADVHFAQALEKVPFSVHHGLYRDETARRTTWHLPQTHAYEQWSDGRAYDGTASIVQPLIAPLYGGRSVHHVMALIAGDDERSGHALVRRYWQRQANGDFDADFDTFWQTALQKGVIVNTTANPLKLHSARTVAPPYLNDVNYDGAPVVRFIADPSTGDGEFANNGWLQELPRPLTSLTWDNAALLSAATAKQLGLETGDIVQLSLAQQPNVTLDAPVWIMPNHADGVVALPLGYGRTDAGRVGNGVGFDAYRLMTLDASNVFGTPLELVIKKTGRRHEFAVRQKYAMTEGRDIIRMASVEEFRRDPHFATDKEIDRVPEETLYPEWNYKEYKWGMAIDLNACIGCGVCTIACQAENNIPVVGKDQVIKGREMHWIRVDHYYLDADKGLAAHQRTAFQPVPCMHCEIAPCEEVCPVGATVHDSEGLNVQVYNRCVGTRFCSNNCPYKVRRFNFLQYSNTTVESLKAAQNPDVTVRRRGVMEKCSYCLQRISRGRLEAEKEGRRLRDGEVVTACQAACPTQAIVFGDLNDPDSRVKRAKASPLDYALLSELNTRPRTTYAARVVNPDPDLEGEA